MTKTKHRFPFVGQHAPFVRIGFGTSAPATGPTITAAGSLSGTEFKVGVSRTITAGTATATGGGTVTYEYQWLVAGASAASTAAYSPVSGDYGDSIYAQWRAVEAGGTNDGATGWQTVGSGTVAGIAPAASTAPSISSAAPAPGDTVTITEGTYTGTPAPTITGVLTLGGVDVTGDMVGLDYTIPGGTADGTSLVWSETASNGVSPDATAYASATVTISAVTVVPITVDNSAGALTTNAQVLVTLPYVAGMQADYSDIRFLDSDGTTEIPFWLESKTDSTTADFWVSVPSLPASTKTLYYSYGNAAVSASDGAATFDFFDGFESGVSGWTPSAGTFTVAQDATRAKRGSYSMLATQSGPSPSAQAAAPFTLADNVYECDYYDDTSVTPFMMVFRVPGSVSGAVGIGVYTFSDATHYVYHHSGYTYVATTVVRSTGWHKFGIALDGAGGAEFFIDGVSVATQTGQLTAASNIYIGGSAANPTSTNIDDVRVRKRLSPAPTVTLGSGFVSGDLTAGAGLTGTITGNSVDGWTVQLTDGSTPASAIFTDAEMTAIEAGDAIGVVRNPTVDASTITAPTVTDDAWYFAKTGLTIEWVYSWKVSGVTISTGATGDLSSVSALAYKQVDLVVTTPYHADITVQAQAKTPYTPNKVSIASLKMRANDTLGGTDTTGTTTPVVVMFSGQLPDQNYRGIFGASRSDFVYYTDLMQNNADGISLIAPRVINGGTIETLSNLSINSPDFPGYNEDFGVVAVWNGNTVTLLAADTTGTIHQSSASGSAGAMPYLPNAPFLFSRSYSAAGPTGYSGISWGQVQWLPASVPSNLADLYAELIDPTTRLPQLPVIANTYLGVSPLIEVRGTASGYLAGTNTGTGSALTVTGTGVTDA